MAAELTSRERFIRMLTRQPHDRIPRFDQFWRETLAAWREQGMDEQDLGTRFNHDVQFVGYLAPAPYPGRREVVAETDQTQDIVNAYGETVRYWKNRTGTPEHLAVECASPDIWHDRVKPLMQQTAGDVPVEKLRDAYAKGRDRDRAVTLCGRHAFMAAQSLLGTEGMLMAMASEPDWVRDIADTFTNVLLAWYEAIVDAGIKPDALWCFDDLAYTQAPLMSVPMYRDLFWPGHARTVAWAHQHDILYIQHTDGDVRSFMDLFLEAGIDALQPLEAKANMDVRELAPAFGNRISFWGNIDMTLAESADRERIEHEVITKLQAGMAHHGYAYHSDHSVPPTVTWDTYQFIMQLIEQHGVYR
jgi:uroporphyrinogen decarboxylase